ncbi:MAG: carbohydrate ABC transporter permease [Actinobacteria bacterium]|nr:carbohydrate ABC transporter permease [Actinomycetota bacterium]
MKKSQVYLFSWLGFRLKLNKWLITVILIIWSLIAIFPLVYTFINSFKTRAGYANNRFWFVEMPTIANYTDVLGRFNFWRLLLNSFITTFGGVILCTIVSFLAAYAISKIRFRGSNLVFMLIIATLMIPNQTIMYPLYQTAFDMKFVNNYLGLIIIYAAFGLPLGTYLIAAYLKSIPDDLLEAARIDGANHFQILIKVMFPISIPAVVTLAIINTVWMWNDLLLPLLIMQSQKVTTLMVAVSLIRTQYDMHIPLISAGLIISVVPVIIAYFIGQRQLIKGLTAGAVKS